MKVFIRIPRIKQIALRTLAHFNIQEAVLSIVFVSPARIKSLNVSYLKHSYVTDILTFDYGSSVGKRRIEGEIVIAPSVAAANAKVFATSVSRELDLYVVHGLLHLLGYDDHAPDDIMRMRQKERELVGILGKTA